MSKLTKQEKLQGRVRIISILLTTVLIISGVGLYNKNKDRKLEKKIVQAQADVEAPQSTKTPEPEQVPTRPVETPTSEPVDVVATNPNNCNQDTQWILPSGECKDKEIVTPVSTPSQSYSLPTDEAKAFIYQHESGNCPTKWQGEHGACPAYHGVPTDPNVGYGLCQSTPASKMAVMGEGWETSYELQDQWCTNYANNRYGGWANAYTTWLRQRWW